MAHVIFAYYGHPSSHKKLKTEINTWRYNREGPLRKGATAPIISEIKFYDVRIPKENVADFCRDMGMHFADEKEIRPEHYKKTRRAEWRFTDPIKFLIKIGRRIIGLKGSIKTPGEPQYKLTTSWYYAYLIGVLPDPEQEDKILKTKREIL